MNRSVILTGLLVMLCMLLTAETQTDWQVYELRGKVKSVVGDYGTMNFNPKGFLESTMAGSPEYPEGSGLYTYDNEDRLILRIESNDAGEEIFRSTYTYNDRGLLVKKLDQDTIGSSYEELTYNSAGLLIWNKTKSMDGSLLYAIEYVYNQAGKLIRENGYTEEMRIWQFKISDYDKKHKLLEMREYTMPDSLNPVNIKKYDPQGMETEQTYFRKDRSSTTWKSAYDEHGNLTLRTTIPEVSKYDAPKRVIYDYDKKGNWTRKQEFLGGNLTDTRTRIITYY